MTRGIKLFRVRILQLVTAMCLPISVVLSSLSFAGITPSYIFDGKAAGDYFGYNVAIVADVNGDR
jgi:hypothetical protein